MRRARQASSLSVAVIVAIGALVLTTATGAMLARLRDNADRSRIAQLRLQTLAGVLHQINAAEWQLIALKSAPPAAVAALADARRQAAALAVDPSGPSAESLRFQAPLQQYDRALERELDAVRSGRIQEAIEIDEREVDPAFNRLISLVRDATAGRDRVAASTIRQTDFYSAVALVLAAFISAALFGALHRSRSRVDDLRRTEHRLRETERRYRRLFEDALDPIFLTDSQGEIVDLNAAAIALSKKPRVALVGRHVTGLLSEAAPSASGAGVSLAEFHDRRFQLQRGDATVAECVVSCVVRRDDAGRDVGWQLFVRDVTERALLQRQFEQAQKMEVIGRLAGGVAHDFNNLLTAILGYSKFLLDDLDPGDPRRKHVDEIQKAGTMAASLTKQLLAFSRKQILKPETVDINDLVTGSHKILQRLIGEDIDVRLHLAAALPAVTIDRGQLQQVLMNLAVNARDAMSGGGTMMIETAPVELDEAYARLHPPVVAGPHVVLAISDTGAGMSAEVQQHLFEPFFTTKEVGKGTGLGLATVYGIVQQCRGHIFVYSELGKGTTFKLYFPAAPNAVVNLPEERAVTPAAAAGQTILVVEDNAAVRALCRDALQQHGYTVFTASNGAEAVAFSAQYPKPIDLLVTDIVMPGIDGGTLVTQLKASRPGLKTVCMTGYTDQAIVQHGLLDGDTPLLQKPFTPDVLVRYVADVLDRADRAGAALDRAGLARLPGAHTPPEG